MNGEMTEPIPFAQDRRLMVEFQLRNRGIRDQRVLDAMLHVPRHEFVPASLINAAYDDRPLPLGDAETISQPYMVAAMTEAARVEAGDKALEVGTGSGYQAAILAYLGARVYSVERNAALAESARERLARLGFDGVEVIVGDGSEGYPPAAPYDIIIVTAAAPSVPPTLLEQLAEEGRLLIPVGDLRRQDLLLSIKRAGEVKTQILDPCQFVPLVGRAGWPENEWRLR
jgi:protein-L-isoaspartate(D-aspartate) O-methyltransferase